MRVCACVEKQFAKTTPQSITTLTGIVPIFISSFTLDRSVNSGHRSQFPVISAEYFLLLLLAKPSYCGYLRFIYLFSSIRYCGVPLWAFFLYIGEYLFVVCGVPGVVAMPVESSTLCCENALPPQILWRFIHRDRIYYWILGERNPRIYNLGLIFRRTHTHTQTHRIERLQRESYIWILISSCWTGIFVNGMWGNVGGSGETLLDDNRLQILNNVCLTCLQVRNGEKFLV